MRSAGRADLFITVTVAVAVMRSAGSTDLFSCREISYLIELVKAFPVLYAADKKFYKATLSRERAWTIIAEKLNRKVTECEKKWRYMRDKYVKERRRVLTEIRTTGEMTNSSWQYYNAMQFLAQHLRLSTASPIHDDIECTQMKSTAQCTEVAQMSRHASTPVLKQEVLNSACTSDSVASDPPYTAPLSEGFSGNGVATPTNYSEICTSPALGLASHPIWAVWKNSLSRRLGHRSITNLLHKSSSQPSASDASAESDNGTEQAEDKGQSGEPRSKRHRVTEEDKHVTINLSLKDIQPLERYSEYHFCISLAQMMEKIPQEERGDIRIGLLKLVTDKITSSRANCNGEQSKLRADEGNSLE